MHLAIITLGVSDVAQSGTLYREGLGLEPARSDAETVMFRMDGLWLSLWQRQELEADCGVARLAGSGSATLAVSCADAGTLQARVETLRRAGWRIVREVSRPPHGGLRAYAADLDDHLWEIVWNPDLQPPAGSP